LHRHSKYFKIRTWIKNQKKWVTVPPDLFLLNCWHKFILRLLRNILCHPEFLFLIVCSSSEDLPRPPCWNLTGKSFVVSGNARVSQIITWQTWLQQFTQFTCHFSSSVLISCCLGQIGKSSLTMTSPAKLRFKSLSVNYSIAYHCTENTNSSQSLSAVLFLTSKTLFLSIICFFFTRIYLHLFNPLTLSPDPNSLLSLRKVLTSKNGVCIK
jgi:hypothetical protein